MPDDAFYRTHNNNASYREVAYSNSPPGLVIEPSWLTQEGQPAVRAWQDVDGSVDEVDIQLENEGLFILAGKAIDLGGGEWRYSYALQNLNSDRGGQSFSAPFPNGGIVSCAGFHDVDYHTDEPYDLTDWTLDLQADSITWYTDTFAQNQNANALRYGTVYSFEFCIDVPPALTTITVGLFKPGTPDSFQAEITGPNPIYDCNGSGLPDECDIDCGPPDGPCDLPTCGGSTDCNGNGIPDECDIEPGGGSEDCQPNGNPDECDIDGTSTDCNGNDVPDECDIASGTSPDCNANGVPDECAQAGGPCEDDCECDNDEYCDGAEWCAGLPGICLFGTPVFCDDGVDCTDDSCNEVAHGCIYIPNDANCDDGLFCNGAETCHFALGCQLGEHPCPGQFCDDETSICLSPLELPSDPVHHVKKHRYLSINPNTNFPRTVSIKVEVAEMRRCQGELRRSCLQDSDCPGVCDNDLDKFCTMPSQCEGEPCLATGPCVDHPDVGLSWFVQQRFHEDAGCIPSCTDEDWIARVSDAVYAEAWNLDLLHIGDCPISPGITYAIYACDPTNGLLCSEPLVVATQVFPHGTPPGDYGDIAGDTLGTDPDYYFAPPDGYVNVKDVSAWMLTKLNYGTPDMPQLHPTMADLHGLGTGIPPNYILNINDLTAVYSFGFVRGWPWVNTQGGLPPGDCNP
jgi:hypothetical protein